ncbi:MAG: hypothetical protein M3144_02235, partial [Actinomycetota bacterium]|nr:hypothetical protein [Actinomycetota bacterium]
SVALPHTGPAEPPPELDTFDNDSVGGLGAAAPSVATEPDRLQRPGRGHARVRGEARAVRQRSERFGETMREVWTFRVERYDDRGNRRAPVPVEMRGLQFDGAINEGDRVAVSGRWRDGTLVASRVQNETTNSVVRARSYRTAMIAVSAVLAALVVVMIAVGVMVSKREGRAQDERRQRLEQQIEQNRQEFERRVEQDLRAFCDQARRGGFTPPDCR